MTPVPPVCSGTSPEVAWATGDLAGDPHAAPDKAQRVQRMFAAIARHYDLNNRLHSLGRDQAWRRAAVRLAAVKSTDDVLDVACGTGDLAQAFADALPPPRSVTGVDFTPQMLQIAQLKLARRAPRPGHPVPRYLQGDAMNLAFDAASFDIVSIAFGIRNVSEPLRALREFHRVLRPGGRLVVLEFTEPRNWVLRRLNAIYCGWIMPLTATLIARDRSGAYRYLPKSIARFAGTSHMTDMLRQAGFDAVRANPMTFGVCTAYVAHRA